jgi:hypothetical protein
VELACNGSGASLPCEYPNCFAGKVAGVHTPASTDRTTPPERTRQVVSNRGKKLQGAKDDKSVREALKGLEESVRNMKDLLGFPDVPVEKKPEDKELEKEKPPPKLRRAADSDEGAKPLQLQGAFYEAEEDRRLTVILPPVQTEPLPVVFSSQVRSEPLKVRLPPVQPEPLKVILPEEGADSRKQAQKKPWKELLSSGMPA